MQHRSCLKPQQGIVLITGLIFLLVLTILGISAVSVNTQQERMAGNARDRNLAFQAAEAALRESEFYIDQAAFSQSFKKSCSSGLCRPNVNSAGAPVWVANKDSDQGFQQAKSQKLGDVYGTNAANYTIAGVAQQPRYMVEDLGEILPGDVNKGLDSGYSKNSNAYHYYRISATATGKNAATRVYIQNVTRRK